jgi:predicted nucleotidyltransferase
LDFRGVFEAVTNAMRDEGIDFALIGGFALAALGVPRATADLDFLIPGERADDIDRIMGQLGYETLHRSADVANYAGTESRTGHVDFLYARRPYSRGMLQRAGRHRMMGRADVKVLQPEDIIGLKVQSSTNNPKRLRLDLDDIDRLLAAHPEIDMHRVREYFRLFDREAELDALLSRRPS